MPFAGYKDFADCVSRNRDKDNPDAYCGSIKHKVEDKAIQKALKAIDGLAKHKDKQGSTAHHRQPAGDQRGGPSQRTRRAPLGPDERARERANARQQERPFSQPAFRGDTGHVARKVDHILSGGGGGLRTFKMDLPSVSDKDLDQIHEQAWHRYQIGDPQAKSRASSMITMVGRESRRRQQEQAGVSEPSPRERAKTRAEAARELAPGAAQRGDWKMFDELADVGRRGGRISRALSMAKAAMVNLALNIWEPDKPTEVPDNIMTEETEDYPDEVAVVHDVGDIDDGGHTPGAIKKQGGVGQIVPRGAPLGAFPQPKGVSAKVPLKLTQYGAKPWKPTRRRPGLHKAKVADNVAEALQDIQSAARQLAGVGEALENMHKAVSCKACKGLVPRRQRRMIETMMKQRGWTPDSHRDFWGKISSGDITKGEPGGHTACVNRMQGKVDDPHAFCAWAEHTATGSWPGEDR